MKYEFILKLETSESTFELTDRHNTKLDATIRRSENTITIATNIELPNKITLHIQNPAKDSVVKLKEAWLGYIKFNNDKLEKLFVYHHPYGQNKNTTWEFGGHVKFEFFEHSAIKYHLVIGSII